jgi:ABC-type nitrate/sulfonate/bicarbonate transport system substrate-binding protein
MKHLLAAAAGVGMLSALLGFDGGAAAQELRKVKVALSAFQDVNTIHVGIAKGFYKDAGIELEIQNTDWPGAQELLIGGHVEMATTSDADLVLQNAKGLDTTLTFPLFYFAGGGLMYDPKKHDWKPLKDILPTVGDDMTKAIQATLEQAKGARVGVSAAGAEYASFIQMVTIAGLQPTDYTIVDLAQEELPPALLSGSIDIMIAGIPQRLAVLKEGYATLMDQTSVPSTVAHAGFGTTRAWADENMDLAVKIEGVILKTLAYVEQHPDEAFPIISEKLREQGTEVDAEALHGVWNNMEFFPNSKAWYVEKVATPGGQFYWKDRFETIVNNLKAEGRITELSVPLEDLNYGLKTVAAQPD